MFKKFKDKLAEEVKSSPQRLQQFAQAAQAAVTSASSSISDITNNDLFSIGDSDSATKSQSSSTSQQSTFRDASPAYEDSVQSASEMGENVMMQEETQRQRRLSNSSFASDVSFRLPSYESPSMYHLQSDMEVSASEAEEKGFNTNIVNLDRVTKEQLYSAYRHTQDRFKKYKTQYADLARHYKLLERENAKARNVLVETQDKALRRISELREQCSLEQSAKAHLERALRIEIEEKNMKIHTLNTKLNLLQNNTATVSNCSQENETSSENENDMQLINLSENEQKEPSNESSASEISILNNKLEKMEHLLNKYKESLKIVKEKNAQLTTEIQILRSDLQAKSKQNEELSDVSASLKDSKLKIQELNDLIEELQNKCNTYEFTKNKEKSILEINLQSAQEEISHLQMKIEELKKKEEEYAISLAENKLSIHKELESKESEIKSLKDSLLEAQNEIKSLHIFINDNKNHIKAIEAERDKMKNDINEYVTFKTQLNDMEENVERMTQECQSLENAKAKLHEQYKCLQLQMKQETAEKLAMVDRNTYLESRNSQLTEENMKRSLQINDLEQELDLIRINQLSKTQEADSNDLREITLWKTKYENLEKEIQDEREELIKLQSEIEKLLRNYELVQTNNIDLMHINANLKKENITLQDQVQDILYYKQKYHEIYNNVKDLRDHAKLISNQTKSSLNSFKDEMFSALRGTIISFNENYIHEIDKCEVKYNELKLNYDLSEKELLNMSNKYKVTSKEVQMLKEEVKKYKLKNDEYMADLLNKEQELQIAVAEHKVSLGEICKLTQELDNLRYENDLQQGTHIDESVKTLETENRLLREKLMDSEKSIELINTNLKEEKELCGQKIQVVTTQHEIALSEITELTKQINDLTCKLENEVDKKLKVAEILESVEAENTNLRHKLTENENTLLMLKADIQREKKICEEKIDELKILLIKHTDLKDDNNKKGNLIDKLQNDIEYLNKENLTLKNLSETISVNVNKLENEMAEVRKSHTEIEKEKDHLNAIIDQLERNQRKEHLLLSNVKSSQTDFIECDKEYSAIERHKIENKQMDITKQIALNKLTETNFQKSSEAVSDFEQKYNTMKYEYDALKEDNRRLLSDIEGLQTYLAKISKENSSLNDKLREYFASVENVSEKNNFQCPDIEELKAEIQSGKEKIDNLTRENTILLEENLELKDQIQSHSYHSHDELKSIHKSNDKVDELKQKYTHLLDENTNLEKRLKDLEQMNQSDNDSMLQMQINNEKLRLSNEKLERRLDESLVSLRHLHALQENTELEYLRNILYEYLTGSGMHSLTLVKVLAAVVKFSNLQTDLVLQKEKERQGFLRQLGLL